MVFPSCIWDIWINSNKKSPYERSEKSETLEKEKSEVIKLIFFKELLFNQVSVFEMTNGHLSLSSHYYENYPLVVPFWAW